MFLPGYTYELVNTSEYIIFKNDNEVIRIKLDYPLCHGLSMIVKINNVDHLVLGGFKNPIYIINLETKNVIVHKSGDFIWSDIQHLCKNYIVVYGCRWAYPYENRIYQINEDSIKPVDLSLKNDTQYTENCHKLIYNPNKKVSEFASLDDFKDDVDTQYLQNDSLYYKFEDSKLKIYTYGDVLLGFILDEHLSL